MATTRIADIIVPEYFSSYVQLLTEQKSRLISSGAIARDSILDADLKGGGSTFNSPSFRDLADDDENISTDDPSQLSTPKKITAFVETQVRLSRNASWSSMDLTADLAGTDPLSAISSRVAAYWVRRYQKTFIALMAGVFAQNEIDSPVNATKNDLTHDISGDSYVSGITDFGPSAFIDATATLGDSMEDLGMVFVNSVIYAKMQKKNLIEFIPESESQVVIPRYLGRTVIVDDSMPFDGGVFQTWLFGNGAIRMGMGMPKTGTEIERNPDAGNGAGQDILYNRHELIFHPVGHSYMGTPASGGPSNADTTNNLAAATSWARVFNERKQIKIARLISREF